MQLDMMKLDMEISKNVENGNFRNRDLDMLNLKQFQDVVNSRILRIFTSSQKSDVSIGQFGYVPIQYNGTAMEMGFVQNLLKKTRTNGKFQNPRINYI